VPWFWVEQPDKRVAHRLSETINQLLVSTPSQVGSSQRPIKVMQLISQAIDLATSTWSRSCTSHNPWPATWVSAGQPRGTGNSMCNDKTSECMASMDQWCWAGLMSLHPPNLAFSFSFFGTQALGSSVATRRLCQLSRNGLIKQLMNPTWTRKRTSQKSTSCGTGLMQPR
jgi:hypothetical protein